MSNALFSRLSDAFDLVFSGVFVTQHEVPYVVSRSLGEPPRVRDARGELVNVDLSELFTAEVYSVSEILEIAGDPARAGAS